MYQKSSCIIIVELLAQFTDSILSTALLEQILKKLTTKNLYFFDIRILELTIKKIIILDQD